MNPLERSEVEMPKEISEAEFIDRFTKQICRHAKHKGAPFGIDPSEYAGSVARVYWLERHVEGLSPEECADEDAAYWEDQTAPNTRNQ